MYLCLKIRYDAMTCNDKETRNIKIIGATLYIYIKHGYIKYEIEAPIYI
jgi:hypothetical protein